MLGLVGGLASVIYPALYMATSGYEKFKYENSLIGAVYPTSPYGSTESGNNKDVSDDSNKEDDNQKYMLDLVRTIAERGKYFYYYSEYWCIWVLKLFCCCCPCKR